MSEERRNDVNEDVIEVKPTPAVETESVKSVAEPVTGEEPTAPEQPEAAEEPVVAVNPVEQERPEKVEEAVINAASVVQAAPQSPPNPPYTGAPAAQKWDHDDGTTGKTVAALILGITAIALSFTLMMSLFGLAAGIVGLILSIKERKVHPSGLATVAFILSLVGLVVSALSAVACVACMGIYGWAGYWGAFHDPGTINMFDGSMDI